MPSIRVATLADAVAIHAIYAPIVEQTVISFEVVAPTSTEIAQRINKTLEQYPWLVWADAQGQVQGYAYASQHRSRPAYQWSVDTTVYVANSAQRQGVGRALYQQLLQQLQALGYYSAYAGITLPNTKSVGLHEAIGFTPVGVFRQAGFKHGQWHDVGWWQYQLQPADNDRAPAAPRRFEF
ncbi:arsinothricin resistance N-acetyltransferase ArsN1 family B [Herpetosiphon geysericola]|uniref:Acetyltransferase n=1 Tax=Herpetosiphon geysericola TaxID=70996 RepID=A0A0P6XF60_9CHLR|nr:arsinothricin resistance N-acetyltransferase ArsN1 family B [Herpetosiphon geysericola]KPL81888.1 acetyltransferase [Herpetosiphon geysericola]